MNCATKKFEGSKVCSAKNVRNDLIDAAVNEFRGTGLEETINNFKDGYILELKNLQKELYGKIDNQQIKESEELQLQINDVAECKKRLGTLFIMGNFDEDSLQTMAAELDGEHDRLVEKYHYSSLSNEELQEEINAIDVTIKELKNFKINKEVTKDSVLNLISNIYVIDYKAVSHMDSNLNTDEEGVVFSFEFKMFERLNEIVEKYKSMGKVHTENKVGIIF